MGVATVGVGLKVGAAVMAEANAGRMAAVAANTDVADLGEVAANKGVANKGVAMGGVADLGVANAGRMAVVTTGAAGMAEGVHRHRLTGTKDLKFYWVC